jgi:hypothetical protein
MDLGKPFLPKQLVEKVREILARYVGARKNPRSPAARLRHAAIETRCARESADADADGLRLKCGGQRPPQLVRVHTNVRQLSGARRRAESLRSDMVCALMLCEICVRLAQIAAERAEDRRTLAEQGGFGSPQVAVTEKERKRALSEFLAHFEAEHPRVS